MSKTEKADLRKVFDGTLTAKAPTKSVTVVQNHDTQLGQTVETPIEGMLAFFSMIVRSSTWPGRRVALGEW